VSAAQCHTQIQFVSVEGSTFAGVEEDLIHKNILASETAAASEIPNLIIYVKPPNQDVLSHTVY